MNGSYHVVTAPNNYSIKDSKRVPHFKEYKQIGPAMHEVNGFIDPITHANIEEVIVQDTSPLSITIILSDDTVHNIDLVGIGSISNNKELFSTIIIRSNSDLYDNKINPVKEVEKSGTKYGDECNTIWSDVIQTMIGEKFDIIKTSLFNALRGEDGKSILIPIRPKSGVFQKFNIEADGDNLIFSTSLYGQDFVISIFTKTSFSLRMLVTQYMEWWTAVIPHISAKTGITYTDQFTWEFWYMTIYDMTYAEAVANYPVSNTHPVGVD